ncbi:MAG: hypothetical protein K5787_11935 [Lentisphaeria bacterium]|nr:hypothetical protein [Lentisphaeria bacterium]
MLLIKKVTNASEIPSKDVPFAEQNIYLLAQDVDNRQIFGRQTSHRSKSWPNSFFITPLEFCAKLKPEIHFQGSLQTAAIEMMLKFNMRGNAVGMYDWIHRNSLTSLSEDSLANALQDYLPALTAELEGHFARTDDMRIEADEIAAAFPSWLQPTQIRSIKIGALESKQEPKPHPVEPPQQPIINVPMIATPQENMPPAPPPPPQLQPQPSQPQFVSRTSHATPVVTRGPQQHLPKKRGRLTGCCSHLVIIMFLIVCIIVGGILKLCKAAVNAISALAAPIVNLVSGPSDKNTISSDKICFQLPQGVLLELIKTNAGSYQPVTGGQTPSYQITIPKDFWLTEHEITAEQWRTMMPTPLNTLGISLEEANDFCHRLDDYFAANLPQGYHFALPTDAEWSLAIVQHKSRLSGEPYRNDAFKSRLYGFHLAIVPNAP